MRTCSLFIMTSLVACGGPGLLNAGPGTIETRTEATAPAESNLEARALPQTTIEANAPDLLYHRFQEAVVVAHLKPGPADVASATWTLQLRLRQGAIVNVRYTAPGGLLLPIEAGDPVVARLYRSSVQGEVSGAALVLRQQDGTLLAALVTNLDLAADGLDSGLDVIRSDRRIYQTVTRSDGLCVVLSEHFAIRFHSEDEVIYLRPGERATLSYRGATYDAVALAAAVHTQQTCGPGRHETISYALFAQPAASRPAP